jgi:hypothetical protein
MQDDTSRLTETETDIARLMQELREQGDAMAARTDEFVRRAPAIALGYETDAELERARSNPDVAWRFAPDRLGHMDMANLIRRNNEVLDKVATAMESQATATRLHTDATTHQTDATRHQTDVFRDQMAELRRFGELLDRRTDALMDAFTMLARDLRGDSSGPTG